MKKELFELIVNERSHLQYKVKVRAKNLAEAQKRAIGMARRSRPLPYYPSTGERLGQPKRVTTIYTVNT